MIDPILSREIYKELNAGHVINARLYDVGAEPGNRSYKELSDQREEYTRMYDALGYELVHRPGFFYIRELSNTDPYRGAAVKVVALLTVIGRGVTQLGYLFSLLTSEGSGLSEEDAKTIEGIEEYRDIMAALGLDGGLWQEIKNALVERRIAYLNEAGRLVLAESGKYFFDSLFSDEAAMGDVAAEPVVSEQSTRSLGVETRYAPCDKLGMGGEPC